jgi:hypothetical protein
MTDAELDAFVLRFRERTLAKAEWTHHAHLTVGTWHVHRYGVTAAVGLLRDGIRALNESLGTINSDSGGYHETITRAYAHLIAAFLAGCRRTPPCQSGWRPSSPVRSPAKTSSSSTTPEIA